ncbi:hypothetical protein WN943_022867 [Citrus x changshan-huyou]
MDREDGGAGGGGSPTATLRPRKGMRSRTWLVVLEFGQPPVEEVGKHLIMRRTGLPARDLRVLDPLLSYPSSIMRRERAVVINLEHVKAIVTAKEVFDALFYQPSGCSVRSGFAASHFFSSSFVHTMGVSFYSFYLFLRNFWYFVSSSS